MKGKLNLNLNNKDRYSSKVEAANGKSFNFKPTDKINNIQFYEIDDIKVLISTQFPENEIQFTK